MTVLPNSVTNKRMYSTNYLSYCKAHNKTPEAMMEHDRSEFPGGVMCGFILWISKMKQEFYKARPSCFLDRFTIGDLRKWGEFLDDAK